MTTYKFEKGEIDLIKKSNGNYDAVVFGRHLKLDATEDMVNEEIADYLIKKGNEFLRKAQEYSFYGENIMEEGLEGTMKKFLTLEDKFEGGKK